MTHINWTLITLAATLACADPLTEGLGDGDTGTEETGDELGDSDGDSDGDTTDGDTTEGDGDGDGDTTEGDTTEGDGDGDGDTWPEARAMWRFNGSLEDSAGIHHGADPSGEVEFLILEGHEGAVFGEAGYVEVDSLAEDIVAWEAFSIAIRIYSWDGAPKQTYLSIGTQDEPNENPSENGFGVWLDGGVQIYSETANAADVWTEVGPRPMEDEWHTLVWSFTTETVRYYADGILVSEMPYVMSPTETTSLAIGGWYGYHPLAGILDQAAVYDYALTSGEVVTMSR